MGCGASAYAASVAPEQLEREEGLLVTVEVAKAKHKEAPCEDSPARKARKLCAPWEEVVPVPERYRKRLSDIPETHLRAMELGALVAVGELVKEVLSKVGHKDARTQKEVTLESVNLYHINELIVMPLTEEHVCSFMELTAEAAQSPQWFISHWWGTAFFDTLRMLALHEKRRELGERALYWMCTFANNQHNLAELSQPGILETPFVKAIMHPDCKGTVALLDEEKATPFTRIWCVLEDFVTIHYGSTKPERQLFDFCTIVPAGECERDDGEWNERCACVLLDMGEGEDPKDYSDLPDPEDAWFPGKVGLKATRLDVTKAEASRDSDRKNILRLLEGMEDQVNLTMRKTFAPSAAYMAVTDIADEEGTKDKLVEIIDSGLLGDREEAARKLDDKGCVADCASYDGKGNIACLKHMLNLKCDPNGLSDADRPSHGLHLAFKSSKWSAFHMLLSFGADPTMKKPDGEPVLELTEDDLGCMPRHVRRRLEAKGFDMKGVGAEVETEDEDEDEDED